MLLLATPSRTASDKGQIQPEPGTASFTCTPTIDWFWDGGGNEIASQVVVINLTDDNGDGVVDGKDKPEVAFIGRINDYLMVVDGETGNPRPGFPVGSFGSTGLAAADLLGDPVAELIAITDNGLGAQKIEIYNRDGNLVTSGPYYDELARPNNFSATISVADIDNSGSPEILIGELVFDNTGTKRWFGTKGRGVLSSPSEPSRTSTGMDLNLDGDLEVLAGKTAYNPDGTELWTFGGDAGPDGASAVGNYLITDPDYPEIVFVYDGIIQLLDHNGVAIGSPFAFGHGGPGNYHSGVFPALGQFDGDPEPEVAETDGDSLWGLDFSGGTWSKMWAVDVHDGSTRSGISLANLDGNGADEIIYRDEDNLYIVDGCTGEVEFMYPIDSYTGVEYPVAADIDGDDQIEVVVTSEDGVYAFECDTWADGRRVWNDYTYHVTNINEDGTVPVDQDTSWIRYNNFLTQVFGTLGAGQFGPWTIEVVKDGITGPYNAIALREEETPGWFYPYISFYNDDTDGIQGEEGLWYATKDLCPPFTPPFRWTLNPIDTTGLRGIWTSIAVTNTAEDGPYVCISHGDSLLRDVRETSFFYCEAEKTKLLVDDAGVVGSYGTDIAVALPGPVFCVVYYDETNGDLKYGERPYNANSWHTITVDDGGVNDVGRYPGIAIDASGTRHVSYYDATNGDLKYATCPGNCTNPSSWNGSGSKIIVDATDDVGLFTEIAVDNFGIPHVSYIDATNQSLKYAYNPGFWIFVTVENSPNDLIASTSIGVSGSGSGLTRHISYSDRTFKSLKYISCTGAPPSCGTTPDWGTSATIPDLWDDVGFWNSIAVSDGDTIHISYSATDSQCGFRALKYAKGRP
jgi:hypothetical protein